MKLPPIPKSEDFFVGGCMYSHQFTEAIIAWKEVCVAIANRKCNTLCGLCGEEGHDEDNCRYDMDNSDF